MTIPLQAKAWSPRLVLLAFVCLTALAVIPSANAQTYTILYSFRGFPDSAYPHGVVMAGDGNLYGTAGGGPYNEGTVYQLNSLNQETILHSFLGGTTDGANPYGALIKGRHGALLDTTIYGGTYGIGTVFEIDPKGDENVVHNFTGKSGDGATPEAGLVEDDAGNFYGTALYGGIEDCGNGLGCGMVFKIDHTGKETQLYLFTGGHDGGWPIASLVLDQAGNLYGTASGGGDLSCYQGYGCGTVFKIDAAGNYSVLYAFHGIHGDGADPLSGLVRDSAGNLYGTTQFGGTAGVGTVFKVTPAGKETVLYSFLGQPLDGALPANSPLFRDTAGNLYGETASGGVDTCEDNAAGCGLVFMLSPTGEETVLHYFTGNPDGSYPTGGLVPDKEGNLYGTTGYGGPYSDICIQYGIEYGCGTVFKLSR